MPVPKSRRRFARKDPLTVFDAGAGELPEWSLHQAIRSKNRRLRPRQFTAVDKKPTTLYRHLITKGIKKPQNLRVFNGDAVDAIERLPPNSQHVIVASFLLNNLSWQETRREHDHEPLQDRFIRLAKKALKPNGRLVVVDCKGATPQVKASAERCGFEFHAKPISESDASKARSWAIQKRATAVQKVNEVQSYVQDGTLTLQTLMKLMRQGVIETYPDYATPTIMLLKKKPPSKVISSELSGLSPAEQSIVNEILRKKW